MGVGVLAPAYARYALVTDPDAGWVLGQAAAWIATWIVFPVAVLVVLLVVLFPTGIPSRFGGRVIRAFTAVSAVALLVYALRPGPIEGDTPPFNPLGIRGLRPMLDAATEWLGVTLAVVALVAVLDAIVRFRRSRGVERLQFRWFLLAVAAFPVMLVSAVLLEPDLGYEGFNPMVVVFALWGNGTAAAIWVAVTRHGLYEIDRIISCTLAYALVTLCCCR